MKRTEIARAGAAKLMAAETALDHALSQTAELVGLLPSLRVGAGLSAVIGQDAVDDLGETLNHLITARRTLIRAHGGLQTVREQIGCGSVAIGLADKPEQPEGPRAVALTTVRGGRAA